MTDANAARAMLESVRAELQNHALLPALQRQIRAFLASRSALPPQPAPIEIGEWCHFCCGWSSSDDEGSCVACGDDNIVEREKPSVAAPPLKMGPGLEASCEVAAYIVPDCGCFADHRPLVACICACHARSPEASNPPVKP